MANRGLTADEKQQAIDALARNEGNKSAAAAELRMDRGTFNNRLNKAQMEGLAPNNVEPGWTFERERHLSIDTGSVVVFSDAHYQPGEPTLAHSALLAVIKAIKPRAVIANGDIFDGGSIGRHPPFGWNERPTPVQERCHL